MSTDRPLRVPRSPLCRVRVAVVDSGVHGEHPHVGGLAGGVCIDAAGVVSDDYVDRIGHGTAVAGAIREKAPSAEIYAVRIFGDRLATRVSTLVAGIDWAVAQGMDIVNLSLGTTNPQHRALFEGAVARATRAGAVVVAARDEDGVEWLPGSLPGVMGVQVDWGCPRDQFRVGEVDGAVVFRASGYPRPVPGVDPRRNLNGISFAVANMSGFLARALSIAPSASPGDTVQRLARFARLPVIADAHDSGDDGAGGRASAGPVHGRGRLRDMPTAGL